MKHNVPDLSEDAFDDVIDDLELNAGTSSRQQQRNKAKSPHLDDARNLANLDGVDDDGNANQSTGSIEYTIEDAIAYLPIGKFHLKLLLGTGMFMISTSLQFSILSFLAFIIQCQLPQWKVTDSSAALLSTLVFFGMLVGTFLWGYLSDKYGRKPVSLIVAISCLTEQR